MPCYHPIKCYQEPGAERAPVFFHRPDGPRGFRLRGLRIPCGRCRGCRLERSRQWAQRCVHEAQLHQDNCFITLTYNDANLPHGGTLIKKHFQDFMKRLRRKYAPARFSFFHCGEYGEKNRRPHYHALLFGLWFNDQLPYKKSGDGSIVYTSEELSLVWGKGFCTVGALTFESAAYVARYAMKKMTGPTAKDYYTVCDPDTGELHQLLPEYITMSLKPAIGKDWYEEYSRDVYPDDFVIMRGQKMKPPKYYDRLLEAAEPELHSQIKEDRLAYAEAHKSDSTPARLAAREKVAIARIQTLKRGLE